MYLVVKLKREKREEEAEEEDRGRGAVVVRISRLGGASDSAWQSIANMQTHTMCWGTCEWGVNAGIKLWKAGLCYSVTISLFFTCRSLLLAQSLSAGHQTLFIDLSGAHKIDPDFLGLNMMGVSYTQF